MFFLCKNGNSGGGGGGEKRTDFYPFSSSLYLLNYGGEGVNYFSLGEEDLKEIDKIYIRGSLWTYYTSQNKANSIQAACIGVKNNCYCFYSFTNKEWTITQNDLSYNWTNSSLASSIVYHSSSSSSFAKLSVCEVIDIKKMLEQAEQNGISFDFPNPVSVRLGSSNVYKTVDSQNCFVLIHNYFRQGSTTNGQAQLGFSVNPKRNYVGVETQQDLQTYPAQITLQYKKGNVPVGLFYEDGFFYGDMYINSLNKTIFYERESVSFSYDADYSNYIKTSEEISGYSSVEVDYYSSANKTKRTVILPISSSISETPTSFGILRSSGSSSNFFVIYGGYNSSLGDIPLESSEKNQNTTFYISRFEFKE